MKSGTKSGTPVTISEKELHSTLQTFLEENEKKPKESIWNLHSIAGLGFVFSAFAYFGHTIASNFIGISLPFMDTLMSFVPYLSGALLAVLIISTFRKSGKKEKQEQKEEEIRVKETYDKLDKFLYNDKKRKTERTASASAASSFDSFDVNRGNKLYRSRTDSYIAGVCGGLSSYLGISSTAIRLIFMAALFLGYGSPVLVYIAMAIVMPKEPVELMDDFKL